MFKRVIKKLSNKLPDSLFVRMQYLYFAGSILHLKKPQGFNEKLQWLKLYDKNPLYTNIVDKYSVREYVKKILGEEYLVPIIAKYDSVGEINWEELPNSFVLKCTHGSGCNIICPDKNKLNIEEAKKKLEIWMNKNFYFVAREWPYKNVKPRIICEHFLEEDIYDYKFYCFNGNPEFLYVAQGDNSNGTLRMNFYDLDWNRCPFYRKDHKELFTEQAKPENFDEMLEITKKLCKEFIFVRVDLFSVGGKLYFGELTLTPGGGLAPFAPLEYERNIGKWIELD